MEEFQKLARANEEMANKEIHEIMVKYNVIPTWIDNYVNGNRVGGGLVFQFNPSAFGPQGGQN